MDTKGKQKAFTLVELLIAMAIALIVIAAISSTFVSQRKTYDVQEQISERIQNGRAAMDILSSEIRMTGSGVTGSALPWIDWAGVAFATIPVLIEEGTGALGSDIIHIAGCFDGPAATLSSNASAGNTTIDVTPVDSNKSVSDLFDTNDKKVICINGVENAVVTAISGDTLTIDTDPNNNQGLLNTYDATAATINVCVVKVLSYSIVQDPDGSYILKRDENLGAGRQPLAENITNLQFFLSGNTIEIKPLTAQTDKLDPNFTTNGGYRTEDLRSFITPPNLMIFTSSSSSSTSSSSTSSSSSSTSSSSSSTSSSSSSTSSSSSSTSSSSSSTSSSSSSTSSTTTSSTTSSGGSCELSVEVVASWADGGGWRHVHVTATVTDGTGPAEDATVEWSINSVSQGTLTPMGSGIYEATSSREYQKNSSPSVTATATKAGCEPGSGRPDTP